MSKRFEGKRVYVTGGGSGVGRATTERFTQEGATVFTVDVNESGLAETRDSVRDAGGTVEVGTCDVSSWEEVQASMKAAVEYLGGLDVLVNCAGIGGSKRFEDMEIASWTRTLNVNLNGPFHTCKAAIPHLLKTKGNIVNVASIAGLRGQGYAAHYSASKGGLVTLTKSIAVEFASRGLRANCVCPGGIATSFMAHFHPPKDFEMQLLNYYMAPVPTEFATAADVAGVIAFVASSDAIRINGAALVADSGTIA